jgi:hypothetical protein
LVGKPPAEIRVKIAEGGVSRSSRELARKLLQSSLLELS